jgi:transcription antitermination factor NusG
VAVSVTPACSPERRVARPDAGAALNSKKWYALRTRSNFEFTVAAALADRAETFLPFYLRRELIHGRRTARRRPLFPGYVFVYADAERDRARLLSIRGVVAMIGGRRPEAIPAAVIENLRIAAADPEAIMPAAPREGELVTVARGPLAGLTGVMERSAGGRRLIIRVEFLNRACALEINQAEVYQTEAARPAA